MTDCRVYIRGKGSIKDSVKVSLDFAFPHPQPSFSLFTVKLMEQWVLESQVALFENSQLNWADMLGFGYPKPGLS